MLVMISCPPPTIERLQSVNGFCEWSESYIAMKCIVLFLNRVLRSQSWQSDLVYNCTNTHAMSYRSDFFNCSSGVNIEEPAVSFAVSLLWVVVRVGLPRFLIPTAMTDSKSLNTSLLEVMISSKNDRLKIRDMSNHTVQIIFDAWWASVTDDSKQLIGWNNS